MMRVVTYPGNRGCDRCGGIYKKTLVFVQWWCVYSPIIFASCSVFIYINNELFNKYEYIAISHNHLFILFFSLEDIVHLLDLPDELILAILNKVKSHVLLFCSMISIGNNRLEQLALDKCQAIDLTFDYLQSPHESLFERFYSHVMPCIFNNIQSFTLHIQHLPNILTFVEKNCDGILPNLTHLRIMLRRRNPKTGTPYTIGKLLLSIFFNNG